MYNTSSPRCKVSIYLYPLHLELDVPVLDFSIELGVSVNVVDGSNVMRYQ